MTGWRKRQIAAGADAMAGDGGYGIGSKEAYDAFVKARNYPMDAGKIVDPGPAPSQEIQDARNDLLDGTL